MTGDRIVKNTFALFVGNASGNILSFLLMVYIARVLGDTGVGQYAFVFAFGRLIILLGNPGLEYLIIRDVPADKELLPGYGANLFSMKIILAIIAVGLTVLVSSYIDKSELVIHSLFIVCIIYGFDVIGGVFSRILQANERMDLTSLAEVAERGTALILGVIFLYLKCSLLFLILALMISKCLREILFLCLSRRYFHPRLGGDLSMWKDLLTQSFPYTLSISFLYIYYKIDTVMLSLMIDDQVTGWYNAAYSLIDVVNYIPFLIVMAIFPSMARSSRLDPSRLKGLFTRSFRYLTILAIPIGVGVTLLAPKIILFVYGEQFSNATICLRILIWAEVIVFVSYLGGQLLNIVERQKMYTAIIGITAVLNILMNSILIPRYAHVGAAVATLSCELLIFVLVYNSVKNYLVNLTLRPLIWRPVIGSLAMAGVIMNVKFLPLWLLIPMGVMVYFIVFFLLRGFNTQDKNAFFEIISSMKLR